MIRTHSGKLGVLAVSAMILGAMGIGCSSGGSGLSIANDAATNPGSTGGAISGTGGSTGSSLGGSVVQTGGSITAYGGEISMGGSVVSMGGNVVATGGRTGTPPTSRRRGSGNLRQRHGVHGGLYRGLRPGRNRHARLYLRRQRQAHLRRRVLHGWRWNGRRDWAAGVFPQLDLHRGLLGNLRRRRHTRLYLRRQRQTHLRRLRRRCRRRWNWARHLPRFRHLHRRLHGGLSWRCRRNGSLHVWSEWPTHLHRLRRRRRAWTRARPSAALLRLAPPTAPRPVLAPPAERKLARVERMVDSPAPAALAAAWTRARPSAALLRLAPPTAPRPVLAPPAERKLARVERMADSPAPAALAAAAWTAAWPLASRPWHARPIARELAGRPPEPRERALAPAARPVGSPAPLARTHSCRRRGLRRFVKISLSPRRRWGIPPPHRRLFASASLDAEASSSRQHQPERGFLLARTGESHLRAQILLREQAHAVSPNAVSRLGLGGKRALEDNAAHVLGKTPGLCTEKTGCPACTW